MNQYINATSTPLADYRYILVGDLSGIQEFIFNVQSEGAAKTLKARSYYVQAVSEIALAIIEQDLGSDNCLLFYNGGGNFYVYCKFIDADQLKVLREDVQRAMADEELYLSLSVTERQANFSDTWKELHRCANADKLLKYAQFWDAFDHPDRSDTTEKQREKWKEFVRPFVDQKETQGFKVESSPTAPRVERAGLGWAQWQVLRSKTDTQFVKSIVNKLPVWDTPLRTRYDDLVQDANRRNSARVERDPKKGPHKNIENGDIIEFEILGQMAKKRSGTDKIAVLKMDADGLGTRFLHFTETDDAKALSDLLKKFFDETMLDLWLDQFEYHDREGQKALEPFKHNIYPVFSGGDDCMFIGGWDAVFEFAKVVRERFATSITAKYPKTADLPALTLSASLTMLDSKYPVVRLAQLAEDSIKSAKAVNPDEKDRISVFGEVLRWEEFSKAQGIAKQLEKLIKSDNEPRGILERIKLSHRGFAKLQDRALVGSNLSHPAIWRMFYFIRKTKNLAVLEPIMELYERALLDAIIKKMPTNPAVFPVAARWAEFLTR